LSFQFGLVEIPEVSPSELFGFDFFAGGVASGEMFTIELMNLRTLVVTSEVPEYDSRCQIATIALLAYAEAFFRGHFASMINICPQLVRNLKRATNRDISIDPAELLDLQRQEMWGFLLAQKYEFNNPKSINGIFTDLIGVTPFSMTERKRYQPLIDDRNLLVHHGGIYKSGGKIRSPVKTGARVFYDSVVIPRSEFGARAFFVEGLIRKTLDVSGKALRKFIHDQNIALEKDRQDALEMVDSILKQNHVIDVADFVD